MYLESLNSLKAKKGFHEMKDDDLAIIWQQHDCFFKLSKDLKMIFSNFG